jgi:hypothetical protein
MAPKNTYGQVPDIHAQFDNTTAPRMIRQLEEYRTPEERARLIRNRASDRHKAEVKRDNAQRIYQKNPNAATRKELNDANDYLRGENTLYDRELKNTGNPIELRTDNNGYYSLWVTPEVMDTLGKAIQHVRSGTFDKHSITMGWSIGRENPKILQELHRMSLSDPVARELIPFYTKAQSLGRGGGFIVIDRTIPADEIHETYAEEATHVVQRRLGRAGPTSEMYSTALHLGGPEYDSLYATIPPAMKTYLRDAGYTSKAGFGKTDTVIEVGAKLISTQWNKFPGLTQYQASAWLDQYFRILTDRHGPHALEQLKYTTELSERMRLHHAKRFGQSIKPIRPGYSLPAAQRPYGGSNVGSTVPTGSSSP